MKYTVIETFKGSPTGATTHLYQKGDEIEHEQLGADLAAIALKEKWIKKKRTPPAEKKSE